MTSSLQTETDTANTIARAAGAPMTEAYQQYHTENGPLEIATPLLTTAGDLRPTIKSIIHIVAPNVIDEQFQTDMIAAQKLLEQCYFRCLKTVNELQDTQAICIPPLGANFGGLTHGPYRIV